jgi:hypothetical protein
VWERHFGTNEQTYLLLPPAGVSFSSLLLAPLLLIGLEAVVVAAASEEAKEEEEGSGIAGAAKKGLGRPLSCSGDRHVGFYDEREGRKEEKCMRICFIFILFSLAACYIYM